MVLSVCASGEEEAVSEKWCLYWTPHAFELCVFGYEKWVAEEG